MTQAILILGF